MSLPDGTLDASHDEATQLSGERAPGVVLLFSAGRALSSGVVLGRDPLIIGRGGMGTVTLDDPRLSRRHLSIARDGDAFVVEDLESKNGTFLEGVRLTQRLRVSGGVLRAGESLFLLCHDVSSFSRQKPSDKVVAGPTLRKALAQVEVSARSGDLLHIHGESGAGKEIAARHFHESGPANKGPFIAVNCATIPEGVAERLLFGTKKGAFSGAHADAEGFFQSANGGTLFLDEVGELDLQVQAKLLRVLESREVQPLGATRAVPIDVRLCSATHRSLRDLVSEKKFRQDLYFRIGRPEVHLPALRERREDIAAFVVQAAASIAPQLVVNATLIEACLLRPWPGNVRELLAEAKHAARVALASDAKGVELAHLAAGAGVAFAAPQVSGETTESRAEMPTREAIEEALKVSSGRVATAARALGIHRTQLRRWLEKNPVLPAPDDGE